MAAKPRLQFLKTARFLFRFHEGSQDRRNYRLRLGGCYTSLNVAGRREDAIGACAAR
jgi:hypothetical protein